MKHLYARNFFIFGIVLLLSVKTLYAVDFEELDKPPEGIHERQIIVGGFASMGMVTGSFADAETSFVKGSTYTFSTSDTTKELWIDHLTYSAGIFGEYVFFDHVGLFSKAGYSALMQRTSFGKDYSDRNYILFRDVFLMAGPSFHLTSRKPWDVSLTPLIGLSYGTFHAAPVARKTIDTFNPSDTSGKSSLFSYGADLKFSAFFSGGFVLSMGMEWVRNTLTLNQPIAETNPQTKRVYMNGGTSGVVDNTRFILMLGYAFSN